jgi:hypothetical protein
MLAAARAAYQAALAARVVEVSDSGSRRVEMHDIEKLRREVVFWERAVAAESRSATGSTGPRHRTASFSDE